MPRSPSPVVLAVFITLVACRSDPPLPGEGAGGRFEASWTGADTGAVATDGTAEWCAQSRVLEIRAAQGDTGVGLAVRVADSAPAGRFEVLLPDSAGPVEGGAAVAVRWFGETELKGFQGLAGQVTLTRGADRYSGEVEATLRPPAGIDTLQLRATFRDLPLSAAPAGCAGIGPPPDDSV